MTLDTSFEDALRVLQSGRSMSMDELQQLPVTWFEVVKMSGNRAQRALLGRTRPRLVGLHVASGQLLVLKLDAIRCAWLKWTRKVQDVQQMFQLQRRMGHATLTQLTLQFFPKGGADHFSDIFLFQEAAARRFVTQVSSFRVLSCKAGADNATAPCGLTPQLNSRSDSAAELDMPSSHSNHSNPLYTPDRSSSPPDDSQMDYKARFHAKLQAKRAAAAASADAKSPTQLTASTELADTAMQPAAAASSITMLLDDELLIEPAPPRTPPPLSAPPPPPRQQQPTAPPAAAAMQVVDEFAFLFEANAQQPAAASSSFYTPPSSAPPSASFYSPAAAVPASTNPFASHATAPTAATWTMQMDPFNSVGLRQS